MLQAYSARAPKANIFQPLKEQNMGSPWPAQCDSQRNLKAMFSVN